MFKDPVCNMMVDEKTAKHISEAGGGGRTIDNSVMSMFGYIDGDKDKVQKVVRDTFPSFKLQVSS